MCGIIGIFNRKDATSDVLRGMSTILHRGLDGYGLATQDNIQHTDNFSSLKPTDSENALGHCLHAIVNIVPQPLKSKKGIFAANCEIYNWQTLADEYKIKAKNDADLILHLIEKIGFRETLPLLDGPYAIAYWKGDEVYLARDIMGIKPIWYAENFAFASEKKALIHCGYKTIAELNPRKILVYNINNRTQSLIDRPFYSVNRETKESYINIKKRLTGLLINSISKRIPDQKLGLLFSGGVDSTFIAMTLKQLGVPFTCYTAALTEEGLRKPEDLEYAKKAAKELKLDLKIKTLKLNEVPYYLKKIIPLIEDSNVVKVGVALPFFCACEEAKKDGVKVMLSGLGSEEIFAGYQRHLNAKDINKECLAGLLKIYERDLYRDDVVTMYNSIELRLPFLDRDLVEYSLSIPGKYKIKDIQTKLILRDIAEQLGMPTEFAQRKKKAAQYGSNFDKAIEKLSAKERKSKSGYLEQYYETKNLRLGVLFSGGKDSTYAAWIIKKQNYELSCLISIDSKNKSSYMYHTPNIELTKIQAEAMQLPLITVNTDGVKELELKELEQALTIAKQKHQIEGVVTGALYSTYQRDRIEKICDKLSLKMFSPLWHIDQENELRDIVDAGFQVIFVAIAADGMDKRWLGKTLDNHAIKELNRLNKKIGLNVAGEGGEYESLVLDCPLFKRKLKIFDSKIVMDSEFSGILEISKVELVDKR